MSYIVKLSDLPDKLDSLDLILDKIIEGDCLDLMRRMPDKCVDAVITDPPYGIGKAEWDAVGFDLQWLPQAARLSKKKIGLTPGTWNLLCLPRVIAGTFSYKWTISAHLKNGMAHGALGFGNWIPFVIYVADTDTITWCSAFSAWCQAHGVTKRDIDMACGTSDMADWWLSNLPHRAATPSREKWALIVDAFQVPSDLEPTFSDYNAQGDCREFTVGLEEKAAHPTPKLLAAVEWFTEVIGGHRVFDPFLGSGTTAVAAKKLGRHFIGCEISPEYCKIAERRLQELDAQPSLFEPTPGETRLAKSFLLPLLEAEPE